MTNTEIETIMYEALDGSHGVSVATSDPDQFKKRLYMTRADARKRNVLDFDQLSFRTSPTKPQTEVWIVRNKETKDV